MQDEDSSQATPPTPPPPGVHGGDAARVSLTGEQILELTEKPLSDLNESFDEYNESHDNSNFDIENHIEELYNNDIMMKLRNQNDIEKVQNCNNIVVVDRKCNNDVTTRVSSQPAKKDHFQQEKQSSVNPTSFNQQNKNGGTNNNSSTKDKPEEKSHNAITPNQGLQEQNHRQPSLVSIENNVTVSELLSSPGAFEIVGPNGMVRLQSSHETSEEFSTTNGNNSNNNDLSRNAIRSTTNYNNASYRSNNSSARSLQQAIALEPELAEEYETTKHERDSLKVQLRQMETTFRERLRVYEESAPAIAVQVVPAVVPTNTDGQDNVGTDTIISFNNYEDGTTKKHDKTISKKKKIYFCLGGILIVTVLVVIIVLTVTRFNSSFPTSNSSPTSSPTTERRTKRIPVLQAVKDRGYINCRDDEYRPGDSVDLCHAIAAAIFDDPYNASDHIQFSDVKFGDQFFAIWNESIDITTSHVTYNMMRDVYEPSTGLGMAFSTPYFYSGVMFAGRKFYVDCADRHDTLTGDCRHVSVCVAKNTLTYDIVSALLPGTPVHEVDPFQFMSSYADTKCNVLAADQIGLHRSEQLGRLLGYEGEFSYGTKFHSNDPLVMMSRGDDQQWADFCNWILRALITAESLNITQEIALSDSLWSMHTSSSLGDNKLFPETTSVFGDEYKNMFRNAIAAVGNYGEFYENRYEGIVPRGTINTISKGDSGLLYTFPFGILEVDDGYLPAATKPAGPISGGTLESIANRGMLRCGVIGNRPGFALLQVEEDDQINATLPGRNKQTWRGLDIEFCRAISAALFPHAFSDGSSDDIAITIVDVGTNVEDGYVALDLDVIDIFAGDSIRLTADIDEATTARGFTFTSPYFYQDPDHQHNIIKGITSSNNSIIGSNTRMKDSTCLSLVTLETDPQWSAFVRWIMNAIIYAEEHEITQESALDMPVVELFGNNYLQMFRLAIAAVGNYDELFNRTLGQPFNISRGDRNRVNTDATPQMIAMPFT